MFIPDDEEPGCSSSYDRAYQPPRSREPLGVMYSFLDTDLYKLTMQQAIRRCFPRASASYRLIDRSNVSFPAEFAWWLDERLRTWCGHTRCRGKELEWLHNTGLFTAEFLCYLADYRFDRDELDFSISPGGKLNLTIRGSWQSTVLWEVPLLATIHELYHEHVGFGELVSSEAYYEQIRSNAEKLIAHDCQFVEVGTRFRQGPTFQDAAVRACRDALPSGSSSVAAGFLGTSNLYFARKFQMRPFGSMAHEWVMGHSVFSGLETANRDALLRWMQIYGPRASTALTDTYTTGLFFENFESVLAETYTTLRQDSGNPLRFIDKALAFYETMGMDARNKTILFSDRVGVEEAIQIKQYLGGRAKAAFALGTTWDGGGRTDGRLLDLVIKLDRTNGQPVCKLGDEPGRSTGPPDLLRATSRRVRKRIHASPHYPN